jgi:hypothetical protein
VDHVRGTVGFCKTCETINGEWKWAFFFLLCVVNLRNGVMNTNRLKGLRYKMQSGTWVLVEI